MVDFFILDVHVINFYVQDEIKSLNIMREEERYCTDNNMKSIKLTKNIPTR